PISSADSYVFAIDRPVPADSGAAKTGEPGTGTPAQGEKPGSGTEPNATAPAQGEKSGAATEPAPAVPAEGGSTAHPPSDTGQATRR
ncbi:MAG: hypothetical protein ACM31I_06125, partial [Deltaproteobacteria bacterium]